jgi:hypothetical protein
MEQELASGAFGSSAPGSHYRDIINNDNRIGSAHGECRRAVLFTPSIFYCRTLTWQAYGAKALRLAKFDEIKNTLSGRPLLTEIRQPKMH